MRSARHPPRDLSQSPATALAAVSQPISPPGHHSPLSPPVEQTTRPAASQRETQALGATSAHRGPASQFLPAFSITRRCRSEEHTSELQSLMRISYAVFCLKKKKQYNDMT